MFKGSQINKHVNKLTSVQINKHLKGLALLILPSNTMQPPFEEEPVVLY